MSLVLSIVIYQPQAGGEYFCSRLANNSEFPTPNIVFKMTMEDGQTLEDLEEEVKQECRNRGITSVVNLAL